MDHYDKTIKWKRNTKVRPCPDVTSHVFSNGDLNKMFQVGNIRDKCLISLATSLGWEISSFVDFKKETLRKLLERQEETGEKFVYFKQIRQKTGQPRLAILNPMAIKWSRIWLHETENMKKRERDQQTENPDSKRRVSDIFDYTGKGILNRLKVLAKRAGIKTTGNVRFHNIRKWVMSGLSRSGFNEFQIKCVLGKAIPMSDQVYLQTLEEEIRERYPSAYENCLNLSTTISKDLKKKIDEENKRLKEKFAKVELENMDLKKRVKHLESQTDKIEQLEKEDSKTKEEMRQLSLTVKSIVEKLEKLLEG